MTDEKMQETMQQIDDMLNHPNLAPFIKELPTGEKVLGLDSVRGLLMAMLESTDEALNKVLEMIKKA